jgi:hypothetical protein
MLSAQAVAEAGPHLPALEVKGSGEGVEPGRGRAAAGVCDDCRLVSEPLDIGDVASLNQIVGAALIFLRVMLS